MRYGIWRNGRKIKWISEESFENYVADESAYGEESEGIENNTADKDKGLGTDLETIQDDTATRQKWDFK